MNGVHKQEFQIRDLGTRSVTFFSNCAQVTRDIQIRLKPGVNEVSIIGLTPSVIEQSIQVGSPDPAMIITNVVVESRINCNDFDDILPDTEPEDDKSNSWMPELEFNQAEIAMLRQEQEYVTEITVSAKKQLELLDSHGKVVTSTAPKVGEALSTMGISEFLKTYDRERKRLYEVIVDCSCKQIKLQQQLQELIRKQDGLRKRADKEHAILIKNKSKLCQQMKKSLEEKTRIREERYSFWPRSIYVVRISIETTGHTTSTSQQQAGGVGAAVSHSLTFSYFTSFAYWSPSYNMALSSTTKSATLLFDAQLTNNTSETWSDCKVTLSYSQIHLAAVNNETSGVAPWRIKLVTCEGSSDVRGQSRFSAQELRWRQLEAPKNVVLDNSLEAHKKLFGITPLGNVDLSTLSQQARQQQASVIGSSIKDISQSDTVGLPGRERLSVIEGTPGLHGLRVSHCEKTVNVFNYELVGLKSLEPSSTTFKERFAHITFDSATFSRIVTPRYESAVNLKAEILNSSTIPIVQGPVGLTLDGNFWGHSQLSHCRPGESFTLGLGIDPDITVIYNEPQVESCSDLFGQKPQTHQSYKRCIQIFNGGRRDIAHGVNITVQQQIPTSNDAEVRVHLTEPSGLTPGAPGIDDLQVPWGECSVKLQEEGEVIWTVMVRPGQNAQLSLAYTCSFDSGEHVGITNVD